MQQLSTCKFGSLENDERWKGYLKMLTADLLQAWMKKKALLRVLQQNKLIKAENGSTRHSPLQQLPGADESKPASHKQIWSMSIFPRHLVLSLVIWLKITHQLVQICFLIGPPCTCYVFLVLSPKASAERKQLLVWRIHSWSTLWRTLVRTIRSWTQEERVLF